jgi:DNA-binding FadR family transcriptional regulator
MRRMLHDTPAYTQLDTELHLLIAAASHNEIMYHLVESIRDPLKDTIREGLRSRHSDEQLDRVQELHERLLAALERGNASEAAQAMRVHFDEAVMALVRDTDVG